MNEIVHTITLLLIFMILSMNINNIKQSQRSISCIIVLLVSLVISLFHLHIFIETIIITIAFALCTYTATKQFDSTFIWLISHTFFLCSLRYSVHGFFIFKQQSCIYESLIASFIQLLFLFFFHISKEKDFQNQTNKEIIFSSFIEILIAGTSFILIAGLEESRITFYWIVSSVISFVMISFCVLFFHSQKQDLVIKEMKERELLLKLSKDQYDFACQKADELLKYKHDALHHWRTLYQILENHDIENAKEYIESVTSNVNYESLTHYATNIYMDSLLQHKIQQYSNIKFKIKMYVQKEHNDEIMDFCLLLSHLIDYCVGIIYENQLSKELTIHCFQKEKQILLEISTNYYKQKEIESLPESLKGMIKEHQGTIQEIIDDKYRIQIAFTLTK